MVSQGIACQGYAPLIQQDDSLVSSCVGACSCTSQRHGRKDVTVLDKYGCQEWGPDDCVLIWVRASYTYMGWSYMHMGRVSKHDLDSTRFGPGLAQYRVINGIMNQNRPLTKKKKNQTRPLSLSSSSSQTRAEPDCSTTWVICS